MYLPDFNLFLLLVILIMLPICFQLSSKFRYLVKIILFYVCLFIMSFICLLGALRKPGEPEKHHIAWNVFKVLTKWINVKYELRGYEHLVNDEPVVMVANHQSSFDCLASAELWPKRCITLLKKSILYAGPFGIAGKLCGTLFIDRSKPGEAISMLEALVEQIKIKNTHVIIFPEGTRYRGEDGMLKFKKGAFHLAVQGQFPIVPVVISSYRSFYSRNEWKWLSKGLVIIEILPRISTKGLTVDDVTKLSEDTRSKMLETWRRITAEVEKRMYEKKVE